ncbi:MAG: iron(II)-dependent oxidoreductase [Gammaproteobacteria bacterium]|jgi:iron(II)-dependent oxidoreductase
MNKLIATFRLLQNEAIDIVSAVAEEHYHKQFHPDLSPIGWHLGHCVFTESYWIKEQLLEKNIVDDSLRSLYVPELCAKQSRGTALPEKNKMLAWAKNTQTENCTLLELATTQLTSHELLTNDYLIHFLIQHYSQHIETMMMVLTATQIQHNHTEFTPSKILESNQQQKEFITVESNTFTIGLEENNLPYDNEHPIHSVELDSFKMASLPVSNGEYLSFMNSAAYLTKEVWSDAGWEWFSNSKQAHPYHWQKNKNRIWYGIDHQGPFSLEEQEAVYGLSQFEAEAYARWAGGRLPHEYEWEATAKNYQLEQTGLVWEWCTNALHPYDGFTPYPYAGYSAPYFDGQHYVLKSGCRYTKEHIKRASFRNYYHPDKRHIFAGCRLVYD